MFVKEQLDPAKHDTRTGKYADNVSLSMTGFSGSTQNAFNHSNSLIPPHVRPDCRWLTGGLVC